MIHEFRAWDKSKNVMIYGNQKVGVPKVPFVGSLVSQVNSILKKDTLVWMQFTGRKDANFKKIYDGDFLRRLYRHDDKEFVGKVKFYQGKWIVSGNENYIELYEQDVYEDYIIGNEWSGFDKSESTIMQSNYFSDNTVQLDEFERSIIFEKVKSLLYMLSVENPFIVAHLLPVDDRYNLSIVVNRNLIESSMFIKGYIKDKINAIIDVQIYDDSKYNDIKIIIDKTKHESLVICNKEELSKLSESSNW